MNFVLVPFIGHLTLNTRSLSDAVNIDLVVIPGGMTITACSSE
jgi:hypothetical protein